MFGDAWQFFWAVLAQWEPLAFGALSTIAFWAYGKWFKGMKMPRWLFFGLISASLLVACFLAWREEHRAVVETRADLAKLSEPQLVMEFLALSTGITPTGETLVQATASISNTGMPSVCTKYRLTATAPDGREHIGHLVPLWPGYSIPGEDKHFYSRVTIEALLTERTASKPIDRGGEEIGVVLFVFPEFQQSPEATVPDKTPFVLSCRDVKNKKVSDDYLFDLANSRPEFPYYPGLKLEVQPKSEN